MKVCSIEYGKWQGTTPPDILSLIGISGYTVHSVIIQLCSHLYIDIIRPCNWPQCWSSPCQRSRLGIDNVWMTAGRQLQTVSSDHRTDHAHLHKLTCTHTYTHQCHHQQLTSWYVVWLSRQKIVKITKQSIFYTAAAAIKTTNSTNLWI